MPDSINNSPEMVVHLQALLERDKALLARELHDELGGYLIAASMDIAELKRRLMSSDASVHLKLDRVKTMLDASIDFTRRLTEELHPTLLDNVGLFAAVLRHIRRSFTEPDEWYVETTPVGSRVEFTKIPTATQEIAGVAVNSFGAVATLVAEEDSSSHTGSGTVYWPNGVCETKATRVPLETRTLRLQFSRDGQCLGVLYPDKIQHFCSQGAAMSQLTPLTLDHIESFAYGDRRGSIIVQNESAIAILHPTGKTISTMQLQSSGSDSAVATGGQHVALSPDGTTAAWATQGAIHTWQTSHRDVSESLKNGLVH